MGTAACYFYHWEKDKHHKKTHINELSAYTAPRQTLKNAESLSRNLEHTFPFVLPVKERQKSLDRDFSQDYH